MKRSFTLIALLIAGASHAQSPVQTAGFRMPPSCKSLPQNLLPAVIGPESILRAQLRADAHAKTTATAYRLTGWSRYDLNAGLRTDTSQLVYSGTRGSQFSNEQLNLVAGSFAANAQPDRFVSRNKDGDWLDIETAYDAANRVTQRIFRSTMYRSKTVMSYDAAGNLASSIESDSAAGTWTPQIAYYYRHNAAGERTFDSIYSIQDAMPQSITHYRLNSRGNIDSIDSYDWDGAAFERSYLAVNAFNAAGSVISNTNFNVDESHNLIPGERYEYTYTIARQLKESVLSYYVNGVWIPSSRDTFGYTGTKMLHTYLRNELWDENAGDWKPQRSFNYTLDAKNRWSAEYFSERKGAGGLVPVYRRNITYNANDLVEGTNSFEYVPASGYATTPFEQEHFSYEGHQASSVKGAEKTASLKLFPNPASAHISLESGSSDIESAVILGASGLRLNAGKATGRRQTIDLGSLPTGIYFLVVRLNGSNAPHILRFIKE